MRNELTQKHECFLRSAETLSVCLEAIRSDQALLVDTIGRFVTSVAWNLHLIVLNHVLLDDSFTGCQCA